MTQTPLTTKFTCDACGATEVIPKKQGDWVMMTVHPVRNFRMNVKASRYDICPDCDDKMRNAIAKKINDQNAATV